MNKTKIVNPLSQHIVTVSIVWPTLVRRISLFCKTSCSMSRDVLSSTTEISDDEVLAAEGGRSRTRTAPSVIKNIQSLQNDNKWTTIKKPILHPLFWDNPGEPISYTIITKVWVKQEIETCTDYEIPAVNRRGRSSRTWKATGEKDLKNVELNNENAMHFNKWRKHEVWQKSNHLKLFPVFFHQLLWYSVWNFTRLCDYHIYLNAKRHLIIFKYDKVIDTLAWLPSEWFLLAEKHLHNVPWKSTIIYEEELGASLTLLTSQWLIVVHKTLFNLLITELVKYR